MNAVSQSSGRSFGQPAETKGFSWLHAYCVFVAVSVLVLICSGGLVTSKGAGLAVPDWPNSYGYNMFAFPISRWVGGVLYEHTHRLIASTIGFLTLILAAWLWVAEPRRWLRYVGLAALGAVTVQGVLGGLRVIELKDEIGIFHACLAQAFLALMAFIALATSPWWLRLERGVGRLDARTGTTLAWWRTVFALAAGLIYLQLALGATMRHAHAGLSIPDFPTAYGQAWPRIDPARLAQINLERDRTLHLPPTSLRQIHLQMGHRMLAGLILVLVLVIAAAAWRRRGALPAFVRWAAAGGVCLIAAQVTLGIETIWTKKAADVATAHVAVGALLLVWSVLTSAAIRRSIASAPPGAARSPLPARSLEVAV